MGKQVTPAIETKPEGELEAKAEPQPKRPCHTEKENPTFQITGGTDIPSTFLKFFQV